MSRRLPLALLASVALLGACTEDRLTAPRSPALHGRAALAVHEPGFRFLPPTVPMRTLPTGAFDAARRPTVRVTCTGATGPSCPVVAEFAGDAVRLDEEGENYSVLWHAPADLALGAGGYRLEVLTGGSVIGAIDLWVFDTRPDRKGMPDEYAALTRGSPFMAKFRLETQLLGGEPTAPAAEAIPDAPLVPQAEDYATDDAALPGAVLSFNTLALLLVPTATVADANALLSSVEGTVVAGIPGSRSAPGIMWVRVPTRSHAELASVLAALRADPLVQVVTPDVGVGVSVSSARDGTVPGDWTWELAPSGGNWGLELLRVPQLWNLDDAIAKLNRRTRTGVIDLGFFDHEDLTYTAGNTPLPNSRHGTHVAGIIGAHRNLRDLPTTVDGVTPFADLVVTTAAPGTGSFTLADGSLVAAFTSGMLTALHDLLVNHPDVRVINISMAYAWNDGRPTSPGINTETDPDARALASWEGTLVKAVLQARADAGATLPVIVAAAANDSRVSLAQARWASPFNAAALIHGVAPIIVVEALEQVGSGVARADYSNIGGHVSAPGSFIRGLDSTSYGHAMLSGTSQAAPHVAGLISYLYTLRPDFASPTMTTNPMRDLLVAHAVPVTGTRPRVDAFAAAVAIGGETALRMLADVDDGTLHGNQRLLGASDYEVDDATDPTKPRDDLVSMRDFRRWRDWLLQVENPVGLVQNGSATHRKKDLNRDDEFESPALENVFPRGDYNGDGIISRTATAPVPASGVTEMLTDLQVLQRHFADANYQVQELPGLLASGDLEVDLAGCFEFPGAASGRSTIRIEGTSTTVQAREYLPNSTRRIYTAPVDARGYTVRALVRNAANEVIASNEGDFNFRLGSQSLWIPNCFALEATVEFPVTVQGGTPTPLVIRVTLRDPVNGVSVPAPNTSVALAPVNGALSAPNGVTNAAGTYTSFVTAPSSGSGTVTVRIALGKWGQVVTREVTAVYAP